jgi:hypothetical protein
MMPLTGGTKDETPPKIVKQDPENKTTNFSGNEIKIEFDEFIQLRDVTNQLIVTPRLSKDPEVTASGKTLLLKFKESLKPNTTYNINFGSSVVDLHEGNIFSGLAIVFSTGNSLDSLSVSGKITDAFTLKPAEASVFLYENAEDSCMFKRKPDYFVKSDKEGNYKLNYVKAGNYKIIALGDKNKNFMYEQSEELIAPALLSDKSQKVILQNENLDFKLYKEEPSRFFVKRTSYPVYGQVIFAFNKAIKKADVNLGSFKNNINLSYFFSKRNDSLFVFYNKAIADTISFWLTEDNSVIDTLYIYKQDEEKYTKDLKAKKLSPKVVGVIAIGKAGTTIRFDQPLVGVDNSKIRLINGKDTMVVKEKFGISDSVSHDIYSTQNISVPFKGYLFLLPGAVKSFSEFENDSIRYSFEVKGKEDLGTVVVKLIFPDEGRYIVQLINEKGIPHAGNEFYFDPAISKSKAGAEQTFGFDRVVPGNYSIRLIKDDNEDMEWTTGNLLKQIAPEKIYYYSKPIKILADWEMNVDWKVE